jgi:hypothetical protein
LAPFNDCRSDSSITRRRFTHAVESQPRRSQQTSERIGEPSEDGRLSVGLNDLPMYLLEELKREKVLKALSKVLELAESKKL